MSDRPLDLDRRSLGKLLLGLPLAVGAAAAETKPPEPPSARSECLAASEPGFSPEERERLRKSMGESEKSLAVIRDFKLPPDVAPALRFAPLKSAKR